MVSRALCESRAHFYVFVDNSEKSRKKTSRNFAAEKEKNLENFSGESDFFTQKLPFFGRKSNFFWTFFSTTTTKYPFCPLAQLLTPTKIFFLFLLDSRRILQNLPFILLFWQCFLFIRHADFICAFEEKQATGDVFFNKTCVLHEIHFRDF